MQSCTALTVHSKMLIHKSRKKKPWKEKKIQHLHIQLNYKYNTSIKLQQCIEVSEDQGCGQYCSSLSHEWTPPVKKTLQLCCVTLIEASQNKQQRCNKSPHLSRLPETLEVFTFIFKLGVTSIFFCCIVRLYKCLCSTHVFILFE